MSVGGFAGVGGVAASFMTVSGWISGSSVSYIESSCGSTLNSDSGCSRIPYAFPFAVIAATVLTKIVIIIAPPRYGQFSTVQSRQHPWWSQRYGSGLQGDHDDAPKP